MRSLNRITISRAALIHNFSRCRQLAGGAAILPLVKADAYGHGLIECARLFAEQGAAAFGVAGRTLAQDYAVEPVLHRMIEIYQALELL